MKNILPIAVMISAAAWLVAFAFVVYGFSRLILGFAFEPLLISLVIWGLVSIVTAYLGARNS